MTTIARPIQGILNIDNIQGNYREIVLQFFDGDDVPIELSDFEQIRMEVKETYSVTLKPFLVYEVGTGLDITGNTMRFVLDETFWAKQVSNWVYDITFQIDGKRYTFIRGKITNELTASQL